MLKDNRWVRNVSEMFGNIGWWNKLNRTKTSSFEAPAWFYEASDRSNLYAPRVLMADE